MAEAPLAVASAVILPESEQSPSPPATLKRRQPSFSDDRPKRPRFAHNDTSGSRPDTTTSPQSAIQDTRQTERRRSGQMEERKRGQRLFGALLGTLSQSSSSTAQMRRTDIEKKQQAKLKLQAEEQDEKKKQKLEALLVVRRREQRKFDKQSMQIRHSNMLAQAHFLQTRSEPRLYYKPWELSPSDEQKIKAQVEAVEESIEREAKQWDIDNVATNDEAHPPTNGDADPPETQEEDARVVDTVGAATNGEDPSSPKLSEDTNVNDTIASMDSGEKEMPAEPSEAAKDHGDNGEELVEGEEDTVIY
ncbi:MAG: hypothetical protein ALECFALPRED_005873 [Alectoria fallacina]|uniref:Pinin/SDK/MemA protein domain-containing protein n=1 Tax=Alectoria fallacina TaxID=1903189 RepID=A0A8H3G022_9LECA|nr:MAG: hypothetical protein ALECFALPRED_005873 [Alectoria fallacina]